MTNPSPTQVMIPTTTSSRRLMSSPSQSPRPGNGSPSNGSSRTWITTMPRDNQVLTSSDEFPSHTIPIRS